MPGGWLTPGGEKWLGPPRGCRGGGQGDREAQTRRQNEKRKMQRMVARREAAANPKSKRGRKPGSDSKLQYQKAAWMRRRLRGKQPPLGMTAFARVAHAKAIRAKAFADQAKAAEAEALVAAAEAEARAQAAETACELVNGLPE